MAHYTRIEGSHYEIAGGITRIDGSMYDISKGRTLINGTGYDIPIQAESYTITCHASMYDQLATTYDYLYFFGIDHLVNNVPRPDFADWVSYNEFVFSGVKPGSVLIVEVGADPAGVQYGQGFSFAPSIFYNDVLSGSFYDPMDGKTYFGSGSYCYNGKIYYNTFSVEVTSDLVIYANRTQSDYYSYEARIYTV